VLEQPALVRAARVDVEHRAEVVRDVERPRALLHDLPVDDPRCAARELVEVPRVRVAVDEHLRAGRVALGDREGAQHGGAPRP
jgi:hypothetical protein